MQRDELMVRRAMADVLTRLFRRLGEDALPFYQQLKSDNDPDILAAISTTSSDLKYLDTELWAENMVELSKHELPVVRRNLDFPYETTSRLFQTIKKIIASIVAGW